MGMTLRKVAYLLVLLGPVSSTFAQSITEAIYGIAYDWAARGGGTARHYYDRYFSMTSYLQPKWYGNYELIEEFAKAAVERTRVVEGNAPLAFVVPLFLFTRASIVPPTHRIA